MDSLIFAFNALAPLIALAVLGYVLRRSGTVGDTFIDHLNRFIFYVALPVLIVVTMMDIDRFDMVGGGLVLFVVCAIALISMAAFVLLRFYPGQESHRPVLVQAVYRGNFMLIGMPLALRLGGLEALGILAVLNALVVPMTNMLSIVTFGFKRENGKIGPGVFADLMKTTMKNPLMIAIIIGLIGYFTDAGAFLRSHAAFIPETFDLIAAAATPMAMVAIGGQFKATRVKTLATPIVIGVLSRLVFVPVLVLGTAFLLKDVIVFNDAWGALIALFASPVAVSSVAVTKGLEGDDELAAQLVLWTTVSAVLTLFVVVTAWRALGLL